jgi:uncharacterized protein YkwD
MKYLLLLIFSLNTNPFKNEKGFYEMTDTDFMSQVAVNQPIDVRNPIGDLLDAALFHATNEQRIKHNLPTFSYNFSIHKAAIGHSDDMIEQDFYNHINPYTRRKLEDRVISYTIEFKRMAENIAQHDLIETGKNPNYCFLFPKGDNDFVYRDCQTKQPLPMMTYAKFARNVVNAWMNSLHHRETIMDVRYKVMACSAKFSKNPYKTNRSPFARITQDFGGGI